MADEYKKSLEHAIHYLSVLQDNYSIMQPEIREAVTFALKELKQKNDN